MGLLGLELLFQGSQAIFLGFESQKEFEFSVPMTGVGELAGLPP